ncbi:TPA: hypothetical protein DIS57_02460 [Candidatus Wolfebacteria bacterium]|uniref:Uncharacterized protein n=2 Tax=Candidatus Wolfeibacteriota TaxID=1752735 RepID=A0A0G1U8B9_9BACT|nr:MAG: hypothetical protein UX70_C0001G0231 [Candidatus Wolfebacteria bacterium GW2011_GWB1_47_1]KKU65751.1 MAG: hypothetical protein UX90_C0002G0127 [Candidatus Wolfebacteria bacterium GW2011_GWD2_47_17]KKU90357.1 MAG: hypothetical protein UY19_C0003G0012 [Candidatus Wolfebacteria bacterium GW2011_GWA2_47_9b]HAL24419.1 hypothetical protein [Candidatus Wolfebacteria bacterium]HAS95110.1 hypothetical protein [Candidatus Wolfebacteria bacterium]
MNKLSVTSLAAAALALPAVSSAQNLPGAAAPSGTGVDPIIAILNTVGNWMFGILIAVAAIYILLAAFKFLTAKGDAKVIADARQALTYSLVAVVVGALTKGLIEVAKAVARGSGI